MLRKGNVNVRTMVSREENAPEEVFTEKKKSSFLCKYCGTQYANKYCQAAKKHDEERGGQCALRKMHSIGISVPRQNDGESLIFKKQLLNNNIEVITIE